ncbi:MAG: VOC family protein [archaeon]
MKKNGYKICSYASIAANKQGYGHIAFQVDDMKAMLDKMISYGGNKFGEVVSKEFKSGTLTFTYATDPGGNIIELTNWTQK